MSNINLWRSFLLFIPLGCSGVLHAASCQYNVESEWSAGFTASVTITNDTNESIDGWSTSWAYSDGSTVSQTWNASLSGSGPYTANSNSYNASIAPGASVTFGFNGTKGTGNTSAEIPTLAGTCTGEIVNQQPVASSSLSATQGTIPFDVTFDASNSSDPEGSELTYFWEFSDGETSTEAVVVKSFSQAGSYSVSLTVNDGELDSTSVVTTVVANDESADPIAYHLDASKSSLHYVTTKQTHAVETNHFGALSGSISQDGVATLAIDLNSVETNIDIRNERMRDIVFETDVFNSLSTVTLPVDLDGLRAMAIGTSDTQTITADMNLHGVDAVVTTNVMITKLSASNLLVQSVTPMLIEADTFNLIPGIEALREIANLTVISYTVPVNFTLFFNTP